MQDDLTPDDERKRETLIKLLSLGAFSMAPLSALEAAWWGSTPKKIADNKSIFSLEGELLVNNRPASLNTRIRAGDNLKTGSNSEAVFVVGSDAFIIRSNSQLEIAGSGFLLDFMRLVSGQLLSVFGSRRGNQRLTVGTATATMGIRGTGLYLEAEPDLTYLCTCYGAVELRSAENPDDVQLISTVHHEAPKYISNKAVKGTQIRKAPFKNHTDPELKLIETLVGRDVPFGIESDLYSNPRRDY